jgi:mannose-1-phosphate guanylyltransferase
MDAIILVGGFGTRLRPLTLTVPKPLLPVGNVSILQHIIGSLERAGVTRAVLALGFKPEPFVAAFPNSRCGGVELVYAVEPEPLDTAGAIAFAARYAGVTDTFVVANGDVLTSLDIARVIAFHKETGAEGTLHLTPVDDPSQFGVVETQSDGKVSRFVEKPQPGETTSHNVNAGTYVLEESVLNRIEPNVKISIERVIFPAMVAENTLFAMSTTDSWVDTGRPETYLAANMSALATLPGRVLVHEHAHVATTAHIVNSVVGEHCVVGAGATITGSVLISGATVAAGASVEHSIVMGTVGANASVVNSVIGVDGDVAPDAELVSVKLPSPVVE